ncbi:UNVERIFIED_CONTAM: Mitochondrial intermediate peptidase [Siphonaria sp. JEL0065]|nr:Mitochondrial intermediate peptidase [Siphonaria sp. JEL0065]
MLQRATRRQFSTTRQTQALRQAHCAIREAFDSRLSSGAVQGTAQGTGTPSGLFGYTNQTWTRAATDTVQRAQRLVRRITDQQRPLPLTKAVKMLDSLSDQLCSVLDATELILNVHPERVVVDDAAQGNTLLTSYMNSLNTDVSLYNALKASIDAEKYIPQQKPSVQTKTVADLLMKDFQKSGIHLGGRQRAEFVRLSDDILSLGNKFSRNSSQTSCEAIEIENASSRLAGIHPQLLNRLVAGHSLDLAVIPMDNPAISSHILQYARDSDVRKAVYTAANSATEEDVWTLESLLRKRMQLSKVLGKSSYSEMWLSDKMAKSPETVMRFLESVSRSNLPKAKAEVERLQAIKASVLGTKSDSGICAWDESFYKQFLVPPSEEGVTMISGDELRPYFSLGTTMQGISDLLMDLYGIWLEPVDGFNPSEVWHPDVKKIQVMHESEGVIGIVYMDLFMREKSVEVDKFEGAAQFTVRCSRRLDDYQEFCEEPRGGLRAPETEVARTALDGTTRALYQLPIVVLVTQFERPTAQAPSLLSLGEVETLFHEMGHVIHSVIARTDYQHISGTRCALDFVEVPSNLLESFARDTSVLHKIGVHYRTGQPVSVDMIKGVKARQGLLQALERQKQVKMAILDQLYHSGSVFFLSFSILSVLF